MLYFTFAFKRKANTMCLKSIPTPLLPLWLHPDSYSQIVYVWGTMNIEKFIVNNITNNKLNR